MRLLLYPLSYGPPAFHILHIQRVSLPRLPVESRASAPHAPNWTGEDARRSIVSLVCDRRRGRYRRRCGGSFHRRATVHQIFQFLAGLEERDLLGRNFHPVARFRVPAHARLALARAEAPKPAYFDLVAHSQRTHHAVKDRIYNHFAVFAS